MIKQANGLNVVLIERKDEFIYNEFIKSQILDWIESKNTSNYLKVNPSDCEPTTIIKFISGGLYGKIKKLIVLQCSDLKSLEIKMGDSKLYKGKIPLLWEELCRVLPQYKNVKCVISVSDINKTSKIFKKISDVGKVVYYEKMTLRQYISFVNKRAQLYHISMSKDVVKYFLDVVDNNCATLDSELKKLSLLNETEITRKTIDNNVMRSKKAIVFELIHSMGTKRLNNSMNLLSELIAQGTNSLQIIALLQRNFRILLYLHCKCNMAEFKLSKWSMQSYNDEIKYFTIDEVVNILNELCECEQLLKSSSINEDFLLTMMLFECL